MSTSAAIYGYRHNFSGKKPTGKPKRDKAKVVLLDLLRPGAKTISKYDEDFWVSLCQYFKKKGHPGKLVITYPSTECQFEKFLSKVLFSVDPWLRDDLWINKGEFDLMEFRKQFDLFNPILLKGLNFYKDRASNPIPQFEDFHGIKRRILYFIEGQKKSKLKHQFNSYHPKADTIFGASIEVRNNCFVYQIIYGYPEDLKPGGSSWSIFIHSKTDENYLDFCMRVFENFEGIISGDNTVLKKLNDFSTDYILIEDEE